MTSSADSRKDDLSFRIRGMDCAEEVATLRRALADITSPDSLSFDVLRGRMDVRADVHPAAIRARVARTGMRAEPWTEERASATLWQRHERKILVSLSGVGVVGGLAVHAATTGLGEVGRSVAVSWQAAVLYGVGVAAGLWMVLPKAWYSLKQFRPDMNLLMTVAVAGAIAIGEWFEAATLSFLFAVSLLLESWSVGRARRAVEALLSKAPRKVVVRRDGALVEVEPATLEVGQQFLVRPGDSVGLDGVVLQGASHVDQASITGESVPVEKGVGDEVFAGTVNGNGMLEVQVSRLSDDTLLARIVRAVSDARRDRSPSELWVDRFARIYTPLVFASAVATITIPPLFFAVVGGNVGFGLNPCPDSVHPFHQGFIEATDDVRAFGAAIEAAVVGVHDDAPGADEPRGLRQPGCLPRCGLLYDDLVAPVGARVRRRAVGDLDEAFFAPGQGVEHQAGAALRRARFVILLGEGKAEQHDIAALQMTAFAGRRERLRVVIHKGLLWRGKTTPAGKPVCSRLWFSCASR